MEGIHFPANVMTVNKELIEIADFEVIPSADINEKLFSIPEEDPYSFSLQECGIDSKLFTVNMGFPLYIILCHITLILFFFLLYLANLKLKSKCLTKVVNFF